MNTMSFQSPCGVQDATKFWRNGWRKPQVSIALRRARCDDYNIFFIADIEVSIALRRARCDVTEILAEWLWLVSIALRRARCDSTPKKTDAFSGQFRIFRGRCSHFRQKDMSFFTASYVYYSTKACLCQVAFCVFLRHGAPGAVSPGFPPDFPIFPQFYATQS